jgi:hypothetical protein
MFSAGKDSMARAPWHLPYFTGTAAGKQARSCACDRAARWPVARPIRHLSLSPSLLLPPLPPAPRRKPPRSPWAGSLPRCRAGLIACVWGTWGYGGTCGYREGRACRRCAVGGVQKAWARGFDAGRLRVVLSHPFPEEVKGPASLAKRCKNLPFRGPCVFCLLSRSVLLRARPSPTPLLRHAPPPLHRA